MARLVVYRNHTFAGSGRITLILDNRQAGDIGMNQFVETLAAPGEHQLEARSRVRDVFELPQVRSLPVTMSSSPT